MLYAASFEAFLKLEKGLSKASIDAYLQDLRKLQSFVEILEMNCTVAQLKLEDLQAFISYLNSLELSLNSQARIISSLKGFY